MKNTKRTPNEEFEVAKVKKKATVLTVACSLASLVLGGVIGSHLMHQRYALYDDPNIQKLAEIYQTMLDEWYYGDETLGDKITQDAINAMVDQGDPYTFYTSTAEEQNLTLDRHGLGFRSSFYGGNYYVTYIYQDAPADEAGLAIGDCIIEAYVDTEWVKFTEVSVSESRAALSHLNEEDQVSYRVIDHNGITKTISFKTGPYSYRGASLVDTKIDEDRLIVTIRIDTFLDRELAEHVQQILEEVNTQYAGRQIARLVFDLRGNGGGLTSQVAALAGLFVPKGTTIMQYEYKDGSREPLITNKHRQFEIDEFVIFQDGSSASASESFTIAMKELTNTTVVGTRSYGKGIVQRVIYLKDGSAFRFTLAGCLSPSGVSIHGTGIEPDVSLQDAFYYFGESESLSEEQINVLIRSLQTILQVEEDDFNELITAFQKAYGLSETGLYDLATAQRIQQEMYDYYLAVLNAYTLKWSVD